MREVRPDSVVALCRMSLSKAAGCEVVCFIAKLSDDWGKDLQLLAKFISDDRLGDRDTQEESLD